MCCSAFDSVLASDKHISFGHFFSGIIGELYGNNREVIREIQNRILGTIMGIIGSGLVQTIEEGRSSMEQVAK